MTPQLRFPEFTDEWHVKKVGEIFETTRGYVLATSKTKPKKDDTFLYPVYSSQTKHGGLMGYYDDYLYEDAITWTTDGANAGEVKFREGKFYCTNVCGVLLSKKGYANKAVAELMNRVTYRYVSYVGNPKLMNGTMSNIPIQIPEVAEQEKIADFLTAVDERIAVGEKKLELLETYKRGVMQKIFSQQIRFKDENGNPYPDWEEKKLGELVDIKSGSSKSEYIERNGANVIVDMGAISSDATLIDTKRTNFSGDFIETDELIMAKDDIGGGNIIGKVVMVPERNKFVLGDHVYKLSPHSVDTTFLYYAINSPAVNREFRKKANGTAQIGITNGTVTMQAIDVPCDDEQQKIADFLTTLDDKITAEKSKLTAARQFKKALLQRMFV